MHKGKGRPNHPRKRHKSLKVSVLCFARIKYTVSDFISPLALVTILRVTEHGGMSRDQQAEEETSKDVVGENTSTHAGETSKDVEGENTSTHAGETSKDVEGENTSSICNNDSDVMCISESGMCIQYMYNGSHSRRTCTFYFRPTSSGIDRSKAPGESGVNPGTASSN